MQRMFPVALKERFTLRDRYGHPQQDDVFHLFLRRFNALAYDELQRLAVVQKGVHIAATAVNLAYGIGQDQVDQAVVGDQINALHVWTLS